MLPAVTQPIRLPKLHRDHLQSTYNGHMLHSSTTDPFKLALYKLMGKIDPSKRTVQDVTVTTEDWLWFQLAMVRVVLDKIWVNMNHGLIGRRRRIRWSPWSLRCCLWLRTATFRWSPQPERVTKRCLGSSLDNMWPVRTGVSQSTPLFPPLTGRGGDCRTLGTTRD